MIVILPIHEDYDITALAPYKELLRHVPGGITAIAFLAILWKSDKDSFIHDSRNMVIDALTASLSNDNDLESYNLEKATEAAMADSFTLFLDMFYEDHQILYEALLGKYELEELDDLSNLGKDNKNLIIKVMEYAASAD